MAEQEKVIILKVGTTEAVKSVNDLKSNIKELKKTLGELEIGSDEYQSVLKELTVNQNALKDAMYATTGTMDDVVGAAKGLTSSYNSLVRQMSELKKEWRATNDEARRNEIGQQIDEINAKLKEMDSSVGNFGRNVGNYVSHWEGMPEITKDFGTAMRESMEAIEPFESIGKIASGVASGFAMVQGAAALLGIENEDLQKTFVKLQAAMALAQGASGLGGLVEGVGRAKVAFQGLGDKVKSVSKAMGKTGWIAVILLVVTAITTLVSYIKKKNEAIKDGTTALEEYNKVGRQAISTISDEMLKMKLLEKIATDSANSDETRTRAARELLKIMGEEVNEINTLALKNGELKDKINDVTTAMIKQTMVSAQLEKLKELYKAYLDVVNTPPSETEKWLKILGKIGVGGALGWGLDKIIPDYTEAVEAAKTAYEQFAKTMLTNTDADTLLDSMGLTDAPTTNGSGGSTGGGKGGSTGGVTDDPNEILKKEIRERIKLEEQALKRKLELLDVERLKEEENAYKTIDDKQKLQEELERIAGVYAEKEYNIEQETLKNKLTILEEWKNANTDANIEKLEIAEEIADLEVEIEKDKQERLTEIAKAANARRNKEVKSSGTTTTTEETPEEQAQKGLGLIDDFKQQVKQFNEEWESMNFTAKAAQIGNVVTQSLAGAGQILNQLADTYANEDEISKEEAKKIKNLRIAGATMDMLSGIVGAISSMAGAGPVGWALGAIQAGIIATTGAMNIANIKKTDVTGNSSGGGISSVVPNVASYSSELPFNYTRNVTTASESANANATTKVVIVESDIVDAVNRVETRESEASF